MESTTYALTVRFPFGTEFWQSGQVPEVQSAISRYGRKFVVVSSEQLAPGVFALRLAEYETSDGIEPAVA